MVSLITANAAATKPLKMQKSTAAGKLAQPLVRYATARRMRPINSLQAKSSIPEPKTLSKTNTKRKISTLKTPLVILNNIPVSAWETSSLGREEEDELASYPHQTVEFHPEAEQQNRKAPSSTDRKKSIKMGRRGKSPKKIKIAIVDED